MKKINTLIIGAGRSGTTSLYHYVKDHPQVCFSDIKEVHFFSIEELFKQGEAYFHSYFSAYTEQKIIATADTYLLIDKKAPARIQSYNPRMKIIVLLRDPIERAYSSYHYGINNGYENPGLSFTDILQLESDRLKNPDIIQLNNLCHFYGSLYYSHISYWMQFFPKEQFLLLSSRDLHSNPEVILQKISDFLNVSPFEKPLETQESNKAATVKSKHIQQFLLNRNHPFRIILRPVIRPLKSIIIRLGITNLIYKINKKEKAYEPLTKVKRDEVRPYFQEDLKKLKEAYNISFPD